MRDLGDYGGSRGQTGSCVWVVAPAGGAVGRIKESILSRPGGGPRGTGDTRVQW